MDTIPLEVDEKKLERGAPSSYPGTRVVDGCRSIGVAFLPKRVDGIDACFKNVFQMVLFLKEKQSSAAARIVHTSDTSIL